MNLRIFSNGKQKFKLPRVNNRAILILFVTYKVVAN